MSPEQIDSFITSTRVQMENHEVRIDQLEHMITQISHLTSAVERLAGNMEHMAKEQTDQGIRLQKLEGKDGELWHKLISYAMTAILSIIIGYIARSLGLGG